MRRFLKIRYDGNPENPREWSNLGTLVCWHSRYWLGDKDHGFASPEDFWRFIRRNGGEKRFVILPLFLYDHGGLTISTSPFNDPWDSGQVGWIYVSYEKIRKEFGVKRVTKALKEKVQQCLLGEVEEYGYYLSGEVYGFELYEEDNGIVTLVDSCYGFYGYSPFQNGLADYVPKEFKKVLTKTIYDEQVFLVADDTEEVFDNTRQLRQFLEERGLLDAVVDLVA